MSEKKVIYADDLFLALRDDINIPGACLARVKRHIDAASVVDAVEVVRCKDCISHGLNGMCALLDIIMAGNDFCSYGERREGE